jgi:hypothetical protein
MHLAETLEEFEKMTSLMEVRGFFFFMEKFIFHLSKPVSSCAVIFKILGKKYLCSCEQCDLKSSIKNWDYHIL